jgi:hypothetical protein
MPSAAVARLTSLLQTRKLDRTIIGSDWVDPEVLVSSGVAGVDDVLGGGWRRGELSEIWGARSSGRTTVLVSTLAAAVRQDEVVALIDPFDRFDPVSASAAGLDLEHVVWVRGPALSSPLRTPAPGVRRPGGGVPTVVEQAITQGVRALDLVIRAGGFAVAALDLAELPSRRVRDLLPWSTWMRLARANEGQRTVCLLVGDGPIGRSPRGVSMAIRGQHRWLGDSPQNRRFNGFEIGTDAGRALAVEGMGADAGGTGG